MEDDKKKEEVKVEPKTNDNIVTKELLEEIKNLKKEILDLKEANKKEIEKVKEEAKEEKANAVRSILKGERGDNDVEEEKKKVEEKTLVQSELDDCDLALKELL